MTSHHRTALWLLVGAVLTALYVAPRLLFGVEIANEMTWSLGVLVQSSLPVLLAVYLASCTTTFRAALQPPGPDASIQRLPLALGACGLYLLTLLMLWFGLADNDPIVLDRAVLVVLLAVLLGGPRVGLVVTGFAMLVRLLLAVILDASPEAVAELRAQPLLLVDPAFLAAESWVWRDPGVIILLAAGGLGSLAYGFFRRRRQQTTFPIWLGLPLAVLVELTYLGVAYLEWDTPSVYSFALRETPSNALGLGFSVVFFLLILRHVHADLERQRAQHAELAVSRLALAQAHTQLRFLQAQINPHFLFNALNTIQHFVHADAQKASTLLRHLSGLLRRILSQQQPLLPLREELVHVRDYVALEQARFGERLHMVFAIDDATLETAVPFLLLQPLVENAIKHAIAPLEQGGTVTVTASKLETADPTGATLQLVISDDGQGFSDSAASGGTGVGLANVRERLQTLYGDDARLDIRSDPATGTRVVLTLRADHPPSLAVSQRLLAIQDASKHD